MTPRVGVVIPARNAERWLAGCLAALAAQTYTDFRVLVVDDASPDSAVADAAAPHRSVEILRLTERAGFTGAANAGITACLQAGAELIALLNLDTRARPRWLGELVRFLEARPERVGGVASRMLLMQSPDLLDDAGNELSWWGSARKRGHGEPAQDYDRPEEVFSICAGAALYRASFFDRVGLFDTEFESYFEDIDIGLRGRLLGYSYWYVPSAEVLHFGHGTGTPRGKYVELSTRNRALTLLKNIPAGLLLRHAPTLVLGQLYFLLAYRRPWRSVVGYLSLARKIGHIRRERARMKRSRVLSPSEVDRQLTDTLGEPSLAALARRRLARRSEKSR